MDEKYPHKPKVGDIVTFRVLGEAVVGRVSDVYDYGNFDIKYQSGGVEKHYTHAWNWPGDQALNHYRILKKKPIIVITA